MTYTVSAIALAAAAGLNAYIPLLGLALADRLTGRIDLDRPFDVISSTGGIVVLLVLLTIEVVVDKIPKVDMVNDLVNSAIRPAAGAFLFMAITDGHGEVDMIVAMTLGLLIAGGAHAAKSISRLRATEATDGMINPLMSLAEDTISAMLTMLAILLPWLSLASLVLFGGGLAWLYRAVPNSDSLRRVFAGRTNTTTASISRQSTPALSESRED